MSCQRRSLSHLLPFLMLRNARLSSIVCQSITLIVGLAALTHAVAVIAVARAEATRLRESITTIESSTPTLSLMYTDLSDLFQRLSPR
jgi:hypothetical protein